MLQRALTFLTFLFLASAGAIVAEGAGPTDNGKQRFVVVDGTLVFDTMAQQGDWPARMVPEDADKLRALLARRPDVSKVVLNSSGGSLWAAEEMARVVIDYGLDTHVDGECSSACVTLFLAGQVRSMARGSKIGFHQNNWTASEMQTYYKSWLGEENGWSTPFEFASWVYEFTQTEAFDQLTYMVDRGVTADFAIRSERPVQEFWYPSRAELEAARVLRD